MKAQEIPVLNMTPDLYDCGMMIEGERITIQKSLGKIRLLLPGWNIVRIPDLLCTIPSKKDLMRMEKPGSVEILAEKGTQWCFLADQLHSNPKLREIQGDAFDSATVASPWTDTCPIPRLFQILSSDTHSQVTTTTH